MKVIFLDIDGVLNVKNWHEKKSHFFIDKDKAKLLAKLIKETNSKVILSSSWREPYFDEIVSNANGNVISEAHKIFNKYKIPVVDKTPSYKTREDEIISKIVEYNLDSYVVFDDKLLDLPNVIQTNQEVGLTEKDIAKALEILSYPSYSTLEDIKKIKAEKECYDFLNNYGVFVNPAKQQIQR